MKPKKQKRRAFVSTYIYDSLRKGIESQTYPLGSYLPSEYQLCEEFKASRMTVRNSLKRLKKEGFITTEPGKGWKVLRDTPSSHLTCKGPILLLGLNQDICNIVMKKIILSLKNQGIETRLFHSPLEEDFFSLHTEEWGGIICFTGVPVPKFIVHYAEDHHIPLIAMMETQHEHYDTIAPDHFIGTLEVLNNLYQRGKRRIGYLSSKVLDLGEDKSFSIRHGAYTHFVTLHNLPSFTLLTNYHYAYSEEDGRMFAEWVQQNQLDTIFTTTSVLIEFAFIQMHQYGISPKEVEVTGASFSVPKLLIEQSGIQSMLAIDVDPEALGTITVKRLIQRLSGDDTPPILTLVPMKMEWIQGIHFQ